MRVVRMVYTEFYKLIHSRGWWLILGLVILIQPLFGLLEAKQLVAIGLDATPQTQPELCSGANSGVLRNGQGAVEP